MARARRREYDDLVAQAERESASNIAAMELENNAAVQRAAEATAAANERARRMAAHDPNVYNPDRPSTWGAADDPSMARRAERLREE